MIETDKTKVMQIIHGFPMGGAEKIVTDTCLCMDLSKYEVVILCFDRYDTPLEKSLESAGIRMIYLSDSLGTRSYEVKRNPPLRILNIARRMLLARKVVHEERPNVIHSHLTLNYLVKFCRPRKPVSLFHTVHSEPKVLWKGCRPSRQADFMAAKWLVKHYHQRFIALHEDMKRELDVLFRVNNTAVLHNGIDFSRFQRSGNRKELRRGLNIPENAFVIGNIGRFEPPKNHAFLLELFQEVSKRNSEAFLLLVGKGSLLPQIRESLIRSDLQDKVLFLQDREDIPDILTAMDVFCFPSLYEGTGIALIEAQKMGVKCVASTGVPKEAVISNLVTRISLESGTRIWADAICEAPPNHAEYERLEDWDIHSVVAKLCKLYDGEI